MRWFVQLVFRHCTGWIIEARDFKFYTVREIEREMGHLEIRIPRNSLIATESFKCLLSVTVIEVQPRPQIVSTYCKVSMKFDQV